MLWYVAWRRGELSDDILSVGMIAVQNGYYHLSKSLKSDSMYYAKGTRTGTKPLARLVLRVSDHPPVNERASATVSIVVTRNLGRLSDSPGVYYAEAGNASSMQEAFLKADAEIDRRTERLAPAMSVGSWMSRNCRFARATKEGT